MVLATDEAWYWLRAIHDLLSNAGEPGLLDWISGVVVPVILALLTVGVALWAVLLARQANRLTERIHDDNKSSRALEKRSTYAGELSLLAGEMLSRRVTGGRGEDVLLDLDRTSALAKAQLASGEDTANEINNWVSVTCRKASLPYHDVDRFMELNHEAAAMIELWRKDPEAAVAAIKADAQYAALVAAIKAK